MSDREVMQVLSNGAWNDVWTRARTRRGMARVYRALMKENSVREHPIAGVRIVTVQKEYLGRLPNDYALE